MGLNTQVWVSQIQKNFYPDSSFLRETSDFSGLVEHDVINMAEAGIDPKVMINNTTYPVKMAERADTNHEIVLDEFSTENTVVREAEKVELSYDKVESVIFSHRNSLQAACAKKAAHAIAPAENTDFTPIIGTTGAEVDGFKCLTVADILDLKTAFDEMDAPLDGRVLVLSPRHLRDLILADLECFKDITDITNGQPRMFAGFKIYPFTKVPTYSKTGAKNAYGAKAADGDRPASFAFCKSEVMRADGSFTMFERLRDPEERGDIIGFSKRFVCLPIRNKGIGAIVPTAAATTPTA